MPRRLPGPGTTLTPTPFWLGRPPMLATGRGAIQSGHIAAAEGKLGTGRRKLRIFARGSKTKRTLSALTTSGGSSKHDPGAAPLLLVISSHILLARLHPAASSPPLCESGVYRCITRAAFASVRRPRRPRVSAASLSSASRTRVSPSTSRCRPGGCCCCCSISAWQDEPPLLHALTLALP